MPSPLDSSVSLLRLHGRYLIDRASLVIGCPFADLLAILEMAGAHAHAVLAEPFPVPGGPAADRLPACPEASIPVTHDVLDWFGLGHGPRSPQAGDDRSRRAEAHAVSRSASAPSLRASCESPLRAMR